MKHVVKLLSHLRKRDIRLHLSEGKLHFNAPKGALTPELRLRLKENKPDIISFLENANSSSAMVSITHIPPERKTDVLSFAQQRLWFITELEKNSTAYNIPRALLLKGILDIDKLEFSFVEIIRRHEILRTTFPSENGQAFQCVSPDSDFDMNVVDLSGLSDDVKQTCADSLADREAVHHFKLDTGPLLRASILTMNNTTRHLLLTLHHIISDGWSTEVMLKELGGLYHAAVTKSGSSLKALPIQYRDFSQWQREWLSGDILANQLDYWRQKLAHPPSMLVLPTDRPYLPIQTFSGNRRPVKIGPSETAALKQFVFDDGATLFMALEAAFAMLLSCYSRQEDIFIGTPVANRNREEIEPLIGFFVNTLVIRNDLSGDPSFEEMLIRTRNNTIDAFAHQDIPLEQALEQLAIPRTLSFNAPFQVMFTFQKKNTRQQWLSNVALSALPVTNLTAKFDLTLALSEQDDYLSGSLEYNSDLFDSETIDRICRRYEALVQAVLANPYENMSRLLRTYRDGDAIFDEPTTLPRVLIDAIYSRVNNQAPAVITYRRDGCREISFDALLRKVDNLCDRLEELDTPPLSPVALYLSSIPNMIAATLACLKTGCSIISPKNAFSDLHDAKVVISEIGVYKKMNRYHGHAIHFDVNEENNRDHSSDEDSLCHLNHALNTNPEKLTKLWRRYRSVFNIMPSDVVGILPSDNVLGSLAGALAALAVGAKILCGSFESLNEKKITILHCSKSMLATCHAPR